MNLSPANKNLLTILFSFYTYTFNGIAFKKISPSIGNGVLISNLLSNLSASWFLINLFFLLPYIAHFDNIITLPLLLAETFRSMFSVFFLHFKQYYSILYILSIAHKILIFLKVIWWKKICIFRQSFSFKHKINKSNAEISTYYWILCLYSKNVCFNVFMFNKCFNFVRNMFYSKIINVSNIIINHMQSNLISSNIRILIKIYYICTILYFFR